MGKQWKQCQTLFLGAPKSVQMVTAAMKLKDAYGGSCLGTHVRIKDLKKKKKDAYSLEEKL